MQEQQKQNELNNTSNARPRQRNFRVPRGTFNYEQLSPRMEGQDGQGGISLEYWILHGMGPLEPVLLSKFESAPVLPRGSRHSTGQRRLAKPDVDVPEYFEFGTPDPY